MDPIMIVLFIILPSIVQCLTCTEEFANHTRTLESDLVILVLSRPVDANETFIQTSTILCTRSSNCDAQSEVPFLRIQGSILSTLPKSSCSKVLTVYPARMSLGRNHIRRILPGAFRSMTSLLELYLNDNELTEVAKGVFNSLSTLRVLDLSNNQIHTIEDSSFTGLDTLSNMNLSWNQLGEIGGNPFEGLRWLGFLDLSHNKLVLMPPNLFHELGNLTSLNLAYNQIERFRFGTFNRLESLRTLDISHNRLLELDYHPFITLLYLNYLYLEGNQIGSFEATEFTKHFRNVGTISLADNNILWKCRELAATFRQLRQHAVTMLEGHSYDVENINGIACDNQILEHDTVDKSTEKSLRQVNASLDYSSFVSFFNSTYKKTNFFRNFDNFLTNGMSKKDGSNETKTMSILRQPLDHSIIIISLLVQILTALALFVIIYLSFFKKFKPDAQQRTLSQDILLQI